MQLNSSPTSVIRTPLLSFDEPQTLIQEEDSQSDEENGLATASLSANGNQTTFLQLGQEVCGGCLKSISRCGQGSLAERRGYAGLVVLILVGTIVVLGGLLGSFAPKLQAKISSLGYFAYKETSENFWISNDNKIGHF